MSTPDQPAPPSGWGDTPEPPRYGQRAPDAPAPPAGSPGQQYGQGQYGESRYGGGQPGQTPYGQGTPGAPPYGPQDSKPGIVPLRPLSLGEIYDGAFSAIRHNPAVMLGMSILVLLVATVLGLLVGQLAVPPLTALFGAGATADPMLAGFESLYAQIFATGLGSGVTVMLATPVVEGILTVSLSQSVIGRKAPVAEVWGKVRRRVPVLVGWALLRSIGVGIVIGGWLTLMIIGIAFTAEQSTWLAVTLGFVAVIGFLVGAVWLGVRLGLVAPALALEGKGLGTTLARAWRLTRGSFWRLFGIYLLAYVIVYFAASIITTPIQFMVGYFGATDTSTLTLATIIGMVLATLISTAVTTIFMSSVVSLLYIDVRMRREGLDVQLATAAASQDGDARPGTR
ncbi:glycerophosphoryl diester phosphodiesterase membrane domain-containing protein [Isoptericola sp. NEAU-Y5]|uniref:Glycerophosphoryl diester phosphodiesterase membrane domain-containing protein n=1 Tax=Isoptericola luteus TaxID=2879484 RepID=A0ABS7ZHX8_9MICO|nr:glycerophosphoryl diester phosphodiesterase membrane domain-containing protein [Isoptericola sp. NEAU-Y5]MCA5894641.1 glycerophosphoryl diester phosphodiesterase membrane domain-containing protein [Isoptericola sp. NEAU-Y5]